PRAHLSRVVLPWRAPPCGGLGEPRQRECHHSKRCGARAPAARLQHLPWASSRVKVRSGMGINLIVPQAARGQLAVSSWHFEGSRQLAVKKNFLSSRVKRGTLVGMTNRG